MNEEFSIQFVSKITGVNSHTIRAWEKRYNAITPKRNETGRRIFSKDNIERLKKLNDLVKLGNNISDIAKLDEADLENMHATFFKDTPNEVAPAREIEKIDLNSMLQNLMLALNHFKLDIIGHELEKAKSNLDLRGFALNVLYPLLTEMNAQISAGHLSVAQEQALTAIMRFHVGNILCDCCYGIQNNEYKVLIAAPEGEDHEFGLLITALLCKHYGIQFYYLGANMPSESLVECAEQIKSDLVIVRASKFLIDRNSNKVNEYIQSLGSNLSSNTKLWLGGVSHLPSQLLRDDIKLIPSLNMLDYELSRLN